MQGWREGPAFRAATAVFAGCGESPEAAADCAEALLAQDGWAAALIAPLVEALAADPLFEPALKFNRDARRVGAVLFDCPAVSIAASVSSAARMAMLPPPRTIVFTGRIAVIRVIRGGGAKSRRWTLAPPPARTAPELTRCVDSGSQPLQDRAVYRMDGRTQAQLVAGATDDVVTLVASVRAGAAPLMREYDIASGALVRVADADDRPSRTAMLLRFLRVTGKADAGDCFAAATCAPDFHLRWAAMREWLALDAERAMLRLAALAQADPNDEVRAAAARMLPTVRRRIAEARCPG